MIFYHASDERGHLHILGTQADARAINKDFRQVDIPTDKPGLMAELQRLYAYIDKLKDEVSAVEGTLSATVPEPEPEPEPEPVKVSQPEPADDDELPDEDFEKLDARVLEQQVDALGMVGEQGLEQFDGWTAVTGISPAFARGVALLNVICTDQHSVAKMFLRDRLKKRKRFGA